MAIPNLLVNTPTTGSIAWDPFSIQYGGVTYTIPGGSTAQKYVWWRYRGANASTTTATNLALNPGAESLTSITTSGNAVGNLATDTTNKISGTGSVTRTLTGAGTFGQAIKHLCDVTKIVAGQQYTMAVWVRTNRAQNMQILVEYYRFVSGTSTYISYGGPTTAVAANTWTRLTATFTVDAQFDPAQAFGFGGYTSAPAVNDQFWSDEAIMVTGATVPTYFDGSSVPFSGNTYSWSGTANNSVSVATSRQYINYVGNPSFEVDTSGWSAYGGGQQTVARRTDGGYSGTSYARITSTSGGVGLGWSNGQVFPNGTYTGVIYVRAPKAMTLTAYLQGTSTRSTNGGNLVTLVANTWTRATVTFTVTAPGTIFMGFLSNNTIPVVSGDYFDIDATMLVDGSTVPTYFDGASLPNNSSVYSWVGTPHLSASLSTAFGPSLEAGATLPADLTQDDLALFGNKNGTPINLQTAGLVEGGLVVQGSILTDAISANAITGEKILAGAIDATKISSGSIQTNHLTAGAVTANEIAANSVTSAKIVAGEVLAANIGANQVTATKLSSTIALASTFQVGDTMTLDSTGISINHTTGSGGRTVLPSDGTDAQFDGGATLRNATVKDNLVVEGTGSSIAGSLTMGSGVVPPTVKASINPQWPLNSQGYVGTEAFNFVGEIAGLLDYDASNYLTLEGYNGGNNAWALNKTGGQRVILAQNFLASSGMRAVGITKMGSDYYVVVNDSSATPTVWRVYRYNGSWAKTGEYYHATANGSGQPAITNDGTYVYLYYKLFGGTNDGKMRIYRFTTSAGATNSLVTAGYATTSGVVGTSGTYTQASGLYLGNADLGVSRWFGASADGSKVVCYTSNFQTDGSGTLTRDTANDFTTKNSIYGFLWDGSRFLSIDDNGVIWKYSQLTTSTAQSITYTLYDSDPTNSTHETTVGPVQTYTFLPRQWYSLQGTGRVDNGGIDDPDCYKFYVNNQYQGQTLNPSASITYGYYNATGGNAPTSNSFASLPKATGSIQSLKKASDGSSQIGLFGDGSGRVGPYTWGADGRSTLDRARVFLAANQTVNQNTWTNQATSTTLWDTNAMVSNPSSVARITIKKTGFYIVYAKSRWNTSNAGWRGLAVKRNNSAGTAQPDIDVLYATGAMAQDVTIESSMYIELTAGDYITMQHHQTAAATLTLLGVTNNYTTFGVQCVEVY